MVNAAKVIGLAAELVASVFASSCAVSPIGCPVAGHRVDRVFDSMEATATATILEDEPGSCQSGGSATAMRHYQPDGGTRSSRPHG